MSLKIVHVIFVIAATLLSFSVSAWSFISFRQQGGLTGLIFGVSWLLAGIGLVVYGRQIVRKLRSLSYR